MGISKPGIAVLVTVWPTISLLAGLLLEVVLDLQEQRRQVGPLQQFVCDAGSGHAVSFLKNKSTHKCGRRPAAAKNLFFINSFLLYF
jgi:hypothetical protein